MKIIIGRQKEILTRASCMLQCFILPKNIHLGPYEELILNLEIQYNSFGRYDVNGETN